MLTVVTYLQIAAAKKKKSTGSGFILYSTVVYLKCYGELKTKDRKSMGKLVKQMVNDKI